MIFAGSTVNAEQGGFTSPIGGFAAAAPELRLSIAFAHGRLVSWVPDNGNLISSRRVLSAGVG